VERDTQTHKDIHTHSQTNRHMQLTSQLAEFRS